MAEKGKMVVAVEGDMRPLKKGIRDAVREPLSLKIDDKAFTQPLGKITGKLGEFDKSLDASNARVIAFGASAGAIYAVEKALRETVTAAITVEKQLADINVILGANEKNLARFGDQLFRIAGQTGQSFQVVANAATELARQGLSVEQTLKRTSDALVLTRLSGLDAVSSVESLTAAINSFNRVALTSTEIVNKLANVDAAFAVSSADLAEALRRVGSTAADAGVSFDQLVAAVTSAQQTTARGGSVIGNSFKTIFTRLQRPAVLKQLEQLGVQTKAVGGAARPVIGVLNDLAKTYDRLSSSQRSQISELIGGVFQINIVKAALSDLGKEYSIYDRALQTSAQSTDEAVKRNQELNKTLSALINRTFANLQKVGAKVGEGAFGPAMRNVLEAVNSSLEGAGTGKEAEGFGAKVAQGIFKGLGDFLSGPGLVIGLSLLQKLFSRLSSTMLDAFKTIQAQNKQTMLRAELEKQVFDQLSKNPEILEQIKNKSMSVAEAQAKIKRGIESTTTELNEQYLAVQKIVNALVGSGDLTLGRGLGASKIGKDAVLAKSKASGLVPTPAERAYEVSAAAGLGYSSGVVKADNIKGVGRVVYGSNESRVQFPGMSTEAIMPPKNSKAGRSYKKNFHASHGFDPYEVAGSMMASGFVPNFASRLKTNTQVTKRGNKYNFEGTFAGLAKDVGANTLLNILGRMREGDFQSYNAANVEDDDKFVSSTVVKSYNVNTSGFDMQTAKGRAGAGAKLERAMSRDKMIIEAGGMRAGLKTSTPRNLAKATIKAGLGGGLSESELAKDFANQQIIARAMRSGDPDNRKSMGDFTSRQSAADFLFSGSGGPFQSGETKAEQSLADPRKFLKATARKHAMDMLSRGIVDRQFQEGVLNDQDTINFGTQILGKLGSTEMPQGGKKLFTGRSAGLVPNFASRTDEEIVQRMTQLLFGPRPSIAGFNDERWQSILSRPENRALKERYSSLKSVSMDKAAKRQARSSAIAKEVATGAKVNTLFLENLTSPTVNPRKPNVRRHGFDPAKLPNIRKTFIDSLGSHWQGLMSNVASDVFASIPADKLAGMGGKAKLMSGLNIRNLKEAPVALGQVTGRLFEEFINSMSTIVDKRQGESGTERLDLSNRRIRSRYQGLFTPSEAMGLGGMGMEIRSGDITNKKALEKAGLAASGFIPNFAKPLYDLDGTIIREGFFSWKDPNRVLGATARDLTPLGRQLLSSGERFDVATARALGDKKAIIQSLSRMGLNVGKVFPLGSMYTSRTEMGKRGKPIKMRGPTKKGLFANTLGRQLIDNDPRNVAAAGKLGKLVNFAATGIFDSDFLASSDKSAVLNAITSSGKPIRTVMGAAGSGKSTYTKGMGTRIRSMSEIGNFSDYILVYGGSASRKGGFTSMGKQVFGATTGGVTVVSPTNDEIMSRRRRRLGSGSDDLRSGDQLRGTMKAPLNNYSFFAAVKEYMKSRGQSFEMLRAGGLVPNFSLGSAVSREVAAGVPASRIRVGASPKLKSSANPAGLGVYNTLHEPGGLTQGINRHRARGLNPRTAGVPNFAPVGPPLALGIGPSDFDVSAELKKFTDKTKETSTSMGKFRKMLKPENIAKLQNNFLSASFLLPMFSGQLQSFIGESTTAGKAVGSLTNAVSTGAAFFGVGGPWGAAVGAAIGSIMAVDGVLGAFADTTADTKRAADDAKEKFTKTSNAISEYGSTLQQYNEALRSSGNKTETIVRLQDKMIDILSDIPSAFQDQVLSAKNATDLQNKVAKGLAEAQKETASLDFTAQLDAMVTGERTGIANFVRRFGDPTGGTFLGMDFDVEVFEEIPGSARRMANSLRKTLDFKKIAEEIRKDGSALQEAVASGNQVQILRQLENQFGLTTEAAAQLRDIMGQDLGELFAIFFDGAEKAGFAAEKTKALNEIHDKHAKRLNSLKTQYDILNQSMDHNIKFASLLTELYVDQAAAMDAFKTAAEKFRIEDIIGDGKRALETRSPFMSKEAQARGQFILDEATRRSDTRSAARTLSENTAAARRRALVDLRSGVMSAVGGIRKGRGGEKGSAQATPEEKQALVAFNNRFQAMVEFSKFRPGSGAADWFGGQFLGSREGQRKGGPSLIELAFGAGGMRPTDIGSPDLAAEQQKIGQAFENASLAIAKENAKQTSELAKLNQQAEHDADQARKNYEAQLEQIKIQRNIAAAGGAEGFASGQADKIMGDFADAMATMRFGSRSGNSMLLGRGATEAELAIQAATGGPSGNMALRNMAVRGRQQQFAGMFGLMGLRGDAMTMGQQNIDALFRPEGVPGAVSQAGMSQFNMGTAVTKEDMQNAHKTALGELERLNVNQLAAQFRMSKALEIIAKIDQGIKAAENQKAAESKAELNRLNLKNAQEGLKSGRKFFGTEEFGDLDESVKQFLKRLGDPTEDLPSLKNEAPNIQNLSAFLEDVGRRMGEDNTRVPAAQKKRDEALLRELGLKTPDVQTGDAGNLAVTISEYLTTIREGSVAQTKLNQILDARSKLEIAKAQETKFNGFIPNFSRGMEKAGVRGNPQYSASQAATAVPQRRHINGKPTWLNSSETVVPNFAGTGKQAVLTPSMMGAFGFAANGYIPNFSLGALPLDMGFSFSSPEGIGEMRAKRLREFLKLHKSTSLNNALGIGKDDLKKFTNLFAANEHMVRNMRGNEGLRNTLSKNSRDIMNLITEATTKEGGLVKGEELHQKIIDRLKRLKDNFPDPDISSKKGAKNFLKTMSAQVNAGDAAEQLALLDELYRGPGGKGGYVSSLKKSGVGLSRKNLGGLNVDLDSVDQALTRIASNKNISHKDAAKELLSKRMLGIKPPDGLAQKVNNHAAVLDSLRNFPKNPIPFGGTRPSVKDPRRGRGSRGSRASKRAKSDAAGRTFSQATSADAWKKLDSLKPELPRTGLPAKNFTTASGATLSAAGEAAQKNAAQQIADNAFKQWLAASGGDVSKFAANYIENRATLRIAEKGLAKNGTLTKEGMIQLKHYLKSAEAKKRQADLERQLKEAFSTRRGINKLTKRIGPTLILDAAAAYGTEQLLFNLDEKGELNSRGAEGFAVRTGTGIGATMIGGGLIASATGGGAIVGLPTIIAGSLVYAAEGTLRAGLDEDIRRMDVIERMHKGLGDTSHIKTEEGLQKHIRGVDADNVLYDAAKNFGIISADEAKVWEEYKKNRDLAAIAQKNVELGEEAWFNSGTILSNADSMFGQAGKYFSSPQYDAAKIGDIHSKLQKFYGGTYDGVSMPELRRRITTGGREAGQKYNQEALERFQAEQRKRARHSRFIESTNLAIENSKSFLKNIQDPNFGKPMYLTEDGGFTHDPVKSSHRTYDGPVTMPAIDQSPEQTKKAMEALAKERADKISQLQIEYINAERGMKHGANKDIYRSKMSTIGKELSVLQTKKYMDELGFVPVTTDGRSFANIYSSSQGGLMNNESLVKLYERTIADSGSWGAAPAWAKKSYAEEIARYDSLNPNNPWSSLIRQEAGLSSGYIPNFNAGRFTTFDGLLSQTRSRNYGSNMGTGWFQNPFYRKAAMSNPGMRGLMNPTGFGFAKSYTASPFAANGLVPSIKASQARERSQSGRSDVYTRYIHTPNFSGYATFNGSERGMEHAIVKSHPNPKRAGSTPNFATDFKDVQNALNSLSAQLSLFTEAVSNNDGNNQQVMQSQAQVSMTPLNVNINHSGKLSAEVEQVQTQISMAVNNAMKQIAPALWRTIKGPATA